MVGGSRSSWAWGTPRVVVNRRRRSGWWHAITPLRSKNPLSSAIFKAAIWSMRDRVLRAGYGSASLWRRVRGWPQWRASPVRSVLWTHVGRAARGCASGPSPVGCPWRGVMSVSRAPSGPSGTLRQFDPRTARDSLGCGDLLCGASCRKCAHSHMGNYVLPATRP